MNQLEFLKYEATPGERHFGIATVRLYGKVILRYKIVPTKDGTGFFPAPASYKMPGADGSGDHYVSAFMLDSNAEKEELESLIRQRVKPYVAQTLGQSIGGQQGPLQPQNQAFPQQGSAAQGQGVLNQPAYGSSGFGYQQPKPQVQQEFPNFPPNEPQWEPPGGMPF